MNPKRWQAETDTRKLALKLAEETGEVCKAIVSEKPYEAKIELRHVALIANRLLEVLSGPQDR
jgi:NTP pyrophosphatase (non-canonical NTP hydrolase)